MSLFPSLPLSTSLSILSLPLSPCLLSLLLTLLLLSVTNGYFFSVFCIFFHLHLYFSTSSFLVFLFFYGCFYHIYYFFLTLTFLCDKRFGNRIQKSIFRVF
uniref:Uncharacterized protein n=1 Tax=Cacopsylla melanoneura TaxID=428564 RepID=A0A8D8ZB98_9HEMI